MADPILPPVCHQCSEGIGGEMRLGTRRRGGWVYLDGKSTSPLQAPYAEIGWLPLGANPIYPSLIAIRLWYKPVVVLRELEPCQTQQPWAVTYHSLPLNSRGP